MKCAPSFARETKKRTSFRGQNEVVRGKRTFYRGYVYRVFAKKKTLNCLLKKKNLKYENHFKVFLAGNLKVFFSNQFKGFFFFAKQ